jgi:hypothetical protein
MPYPLRPVGGPPLLSPRPTPMFVGEGKSAVSSVWKELTAISNKLQEEREKLRLKEEDLKEREEALIDSENHFEQVHTPQWGGMCRKSGESWRVVQDPAQPTLTLRSAGGHPWTGLLLPLHFLE